MKLAQRLFSNITTTTGCKPRKPFAMPTVKRAAIFSTSSDIYTNLALEHWFYKNYPQPPFADGHLLMLWVNQPCVVIGRHQNPWSECNASWMSATCTPLARRNSGGGTVYHDAGNLNLTFFTPKAHYDRRTNLDFIAACINSEHNLNIEVNCREDLVVSDSRKISGTAAKVARHCAYHHCTLLVDANRDNLRSALSDTKWHYASNATASTKSPIANLHKENASITVNSLINSLARKYLQWNNLNFQPNELNLKQNAIGKELANLEKQEVEKISMDSLQLQVVTPSERNFPGLDNIREEYKSWEWTYGKTPPFTATQMFATLGSKQSGGANQRKVFFNSSRKFNFELSLRVENCVIRDVFIKVNDNCNASIGKILRKLEKVGVKVGMKYDVHLIETVEKEFDVPEQNNEIITQEIRTVSS